MMRHLTMLELEAGLDEIRRSPKDGGALEMIVRRPAAGAREVVEQAVIDLVEGLIGDNWKSRGNARTSDRQADPEAQLTVMNSRAVGLVAGEKGRWPLAGDQ